MLRRLQAQLKIGPVDDPLEREADAVADQVMRMPDREHGLTATLSPPRISRVCAECSAEDETLQTKRDGAATAGEEASTIVDKALSSPGQPLDGTTRAFFEPRFGRDFSGVRIHTGLIAEESARAVDALAYTVGSHIAFVGGQYDPHSAEGGRLLAHELAHTLQQDAIGPSSTVQRTAASCPSTWNETVHDDHNRALDMLDRARATLSSYDGTNPPEVKAALEKHFKASGPGFAGWVLLNLDLLRLAAPFASYDCEDTASWWCKDPGTLAETFWCIPLIDIRVCQPLYFLQSDTERSTTLIHEWVHKYGCNFDLGYAAEPDYPKQWTISALINADPFAQLVKDIQGVAPAVAPRPAPSGPVSGSSGGSGGDSGSASGGGGGISNGAGNGSSGGGTGDSGSGGY
jgi:uncharacterized membrane protein YgcG